MAQNKDTAVNFRTQPALKKSFEEALEKQSQFGSATGFFEDCMRAMIIAVRDGKELEVPLGFLDRQRRDK